MKRRSHANTIVPLMEAISCLGVVAESLGANVARLRTGSEPVSVLFTGTEFGSGTTLMAASCAAGIATLTGEQVLLVEANMARPGLGRYAGIGDTPGLEDYLAGRSSLDDAAPYVPGCHGLRVLCATGRGGPNARMSPRAEVKKKLAELVSSSPFVVFDAPPLHLEPGYSLLLAFVQHAIMVVKARGSLKGDVMRSTELIELAGVDLIGSILNRFKSDVPFSRHE